MTARLMTFAALAAVAAASAAADPPKAQTQQPDQATTRPAELVLASADQASATRPSTDQQSQPPARHRAARVTTCRCGDQQTPDQ